MTSRKVSVLCAMLGLKVDKSSCVGPRNRNHAEGRGVHSDASVENCARAVCTLKSGHFSFVYGNPDSSVRLLPEEYRNSRHKVKACGRCTPEQHLLAPHATNSTLKPRRLAPWRIGQKVTSWTVALCTVTRNVLLLPLIMDSLC